MNKARIALLEKVLAATSQPGELRAVLWETAKAHRASLDDVILSGLGRGGTPEGAKAAQTLKGLGFDFAPFALAGWPFVCPDCKGYVPSLAVCGSCRASTCAGCTSIHGCPACRAKTEARIARGKSATAEQEATRKWMQRQMAQEIPPEPPEELREPTPPPPMPQPIPPPDLVWPQDDGTVHPGMWSPHSAESPDSGLSAPPPDGVE